jgi:hypothetical protein
MQAITTKYSPPSSRTTARIHAVAAAGSLFVVWDYRYGETRNHQLAAQKLAKKLEWDGMWVLGVTSTGKFVWVNATDPHPQDTFRIERKPAPMDEVSKTIERVINEA